MFNFYGSTMTLDDLDHKKCLFYDTRCQNVDKVIARLNRYKLNINDYTDESKQSLLHIAVRSGNRDLCNKLLSHGANIYKIDIFGETPLDIAVQKNNIVLIKLLLNGDIYSYKNEIITTKNENIKLIDKNNELEKTNKKLLETNIDLTKKWNNETIRADIEIKTRKRLREELDNTCRENKRLKIENDNLKIDNKILQDTIITLRKSHKK